jgi:hypothetical protein
MYTRELLLAAGLLLLLVVLGRREHLAFTETIKDVRFNADQTEQDRIFALAPTSLQQKAVALNAAMENPVDRSKIYVAEFIRNFQWKVYMPATAPITETVVDNFVSSERATLQSTTVGAGNLLVPFYLEAYSNGDAKRLLMAYLNLTPAGTIPPLSSVPTSSVSIPKLLEQMRDNLLEYKMTGRSEYKSVYDGTKAWLDQYISTLNTQLTTQADSITADVNSYRSANTEMAQTQTDFTRLRTEGPQVEDAYLTIKQQMNEVPEPDTTNLYVKGGIAVGLVLGAIALSVL